MAKIKVSPKTHSVTLHLDSHEEAIFLFELVGSIRGSTKSRRKYGDDLFEEFMRAGFTLADLKKDCIGSLEFKDLK
jgi:hypothetical protein